MKVPPEIVYKGVEATTELDTLLQKQIARLEKVCDYIVSLQVSIEKEQGRHRLGNPYQVRVDIMIPPNHQIVVKRQSILYAGSRLPAAEDVEIIDEDIKHAAVTSRKEDPLPAVIRRAFDTSRRQLERFVERHRGEVKSHPQNRITAFVDRLFRVEGYGFLRSTEGQQIYFHKNSTLHGEWERMVVGTGVRYASELGEKGLQATSVEIVNKPGASEMHDALHELPVVAVPKKRAVKSRK